jgi:hypothetical protein
MAVYLSNAFSLQMQEDNDCTTRKCGLDEVKSIIINLVPGPYIDRESEKDGSDAVYALTAQSCVGHADVAAVLSGLVGFTVPVNRISVALQPGDTLVVGQYVGPRLPEGCSTLPNGARVEWYIVSCRKAGSVAGLDEMRNDLYHAAADMEWPEIGQKSLRAVAEKYFPQYFEENAFD